MNVDEETEAAAARLAEASVMEVGVESEAVPPLGGPGSSREVEAGQDGSQHPSSEDEMDMEIFKHPLLNPRDAVDYWNHSLEKVN